MLLTAGSAGYASATRPHTASVKQRPARVAPVASADDLVAALAEIERATPPGERWDVVVQATGHGAGAEVDGSTVLLDTSAMTAVAIDPDTRVATVGAGATWSQVNAEAERHGLLGRAGTSPTVSVSGYTFGGGVGWLARRAGLASDSLRRVHYVDGRGIARTAADDAPDPIDREAVWAFRGAGGVGIAHTLELDLVPVAHLHAGALLWPAALLPDLVGAWAAEIGRVGPSVSTSLSVLHVPPASPLPDALHGAVAVHLAVADPDGPEGASSLLAAMRAVGRPAMDTWGPTDAAGLARIHLDPPGATPAVGDARWLGAGTPAIAAELLATAAADDSPLVMMELRHVAGAPHARDGAVVVPQGDFVYHAVAALGRADRPGIDGAFAAAREVWSAVDAGSTPGSWREGAAVVPDALPAPILARARAAADLVDPDRRVRRSRLLG